MRKNKIIFLLLLTSFLAGCNNTSSSVSEENSSNLPFESVSSDILSEEISSEESIGEVVELNVRNSVPFRLSSIKDLVEDDGTATYHMISPYNDTYEIRCNDASKIEIYNKHRVLIKETINKTTISLSKDEEVYVKISAPLNVMFSFVVEAEQHYVELPYEINSSIDMTSLPTYSDSTSNPTKPYEVKYTKRDDGRGLYVNSNNPEKITTNEFDTCLTRQEVTDKDVFFTFEHNNANNSFYYYGYRVTNTDDKDIYITVKNLGYQISGAGSWLGEDEWIKFYNTKFHVDTESLTTSQKGSFDAWIGFCNTYTSNNRKPITYRVPAGQYIYVMGGTTADAYQNINVFDSANKRVKGGCGNGAVIFTVSGGTAEGAFLVYKDRDASTINASEYITNKQETGYVVTRDGENVGSQYIGYDYCHGVVDADLMWTFNDSTPSRNLPVTYQNPFYTNTHTGTPYGEIKKFTTKYHDNVTDWVTHINPNHTKEAIGTDMTKYITIDSVTKKPISIDTYHYDGKGSTANIGNWMVDYIDTFTLVNQGERTRKFTYKLRHNGAILAFVRDEEGFISETYQPKYCLRVGDSVYGDGIEDLFIYTVEVKPHSIVRFSVDYNLLANASGYIKHTATLD